MAGLLRAIGGIAKGIGQGMIEQAKQERENAIMQFNRGNQVADRDAGFAHQDSMQAAQFGQQDKTLNTTEAGADRRQGVSEAGSDRRQGVSEAGSDRRLGVSEAGSDRRQAATITAAKETADTAAGQFADVKPQADGTYVAINKKGEAKQITDPSGKPIVSTNDKVPPSVSAALLKAHTVIDPSTELPIVDMPAYLKDMALAQKQYSHQPDGSPMADTYLSRDPSALQQPGAGGLTSNLFGKTAPPVLAAEKPTAQTVPNPPPPAAVDYLKKNPSQRAAFDQKYGQGAAAKALGK